MARILGRKIDLDAVSQQSEWELEVNEYGGGIRNSLFFDYREGMRLVVGVSFGKDMKIIAVDIEVYYSDGCGRPSYRDYSPTRSEIKQIYDQIEGFILVTRRAENRMRKKELNIKLCDAAKHGKTEEISNLLDQGAAVNAADKDGVTALMIAAQNNHFSFTQQLINRGADIIISNKYGGTALMRAAGKGHVEIVRFLIEKGANVNKMSNTGFTALLAAASNGYLEVVITLLEHGAEVNVKDVYGRTALMLAEQKQFNEVINKLLEYGSEKVQAPKQPLD